ncbi:membrane protein [Streptomyces sp. NRRL WC-3618]|nr:membrane protein [Streptomyces sp. NRRL WC-3618]
MYRRSASGGRSPSRGRAALLCLILLVVGSPWGQDRAHDLFIGHFESETIRWLVEGAFVPRWDLSTDRYIDYAGSNMLVVQNISVVLLLVALTRVMSRSTARGTAGWGRCILAGVLVSEVVSLLRWWMLDAFVDGLHLSTPELRYELLHPALSFGLTSGVLLALLTVGLPRVSVPGSAGATKALFRPNRPNRPNRSRKADAAMTTTLRAHMPVGSVPGDVTRYLCAAAYVDEEFADRVVDGVLADEVGAVAPSPGVDLVAVAHHCLAAQEMRRQRDLRLAGAFAVVALFAPLWLLFSAVFLSFTASVGRSRDGRATRGQRQPGNRALVSTAVTAAVVVPFSFPLASAIASLPVSGFVSWLLGAYLGGVPAVLASVGAVVFAYVTVVRHDLGIDRLLRTTMTRTAFARRRLPALPLKQWIVNRMAVVKEARDGNVTVYSGYSPFVGYSPAASNWSVAVPLLPSEDRADKSRRPGGPEAFDVVELVAHVREHLRTVAARGNTDRVASSGAAESLGSLTIEDRVFVNGTTIGDDPRFMTPAGLAPAMRLPAEAVEDIMRRPTGAVRHHLAVYVPLWGDDVVPSVLLHFSTEGRTLHLQCGNHVLGPVGAVYHVVDRLRDPLTPERQRGLLADALPRTGPAFFGAPSRALRQARFEARRTRRMADELTAMEQDPVFDYGARLSMREIATSPVYQNYFQVVDADRVTSAVQRHTLAAIREFLDARGYDTTDFRAQQQTILNQGVIQQGGTSIIGNQAIGTGASATQNVAQTTGPAAAGAQK